MDDRVSANSNLSRYIGAQKMGTSYLLSGHLWLEHLLVRGLIATLQRPDALFTARSPSFHLLVALCEAHGVVEPQLAEALRLINSMRNRAAHQAHYYPADSEWAVVRLALERTGEDLSRFPDEWGEPLEAAAELLERRVRAAGATDIEALLPEDDGKGTPSAEGRL
jgi:hypothetical protein